MGLNGLEMMLDLILIQEIKNHLFLVHGKLKYTQDYIFTNEASNINKKLIY